MSIGWFLKTDDKSTRYNSYGLHEFSAIMIIKLNLKCFFKKVHTSTCNFLNLMIIFEIFPGKCLIKII